MSATDIPDDINPDEDLHVASEVRPGWLLWHADFGPQGGWLPIETIRPMQDIPYSDDVEILFTVRVPDGRKWGGRQYATGLVIARPPAIEDEDA